MTRSNNEPIAIPDLAVLGGPLDYVREMLIDTVRGSLLARNGRSMRVGECLFLGEKRSCSGHHCTARRRAQTIVAHVAAVKAARTGIALCRAQVAVFQRRNAAEERRRQGGPSC
jgi:hypothetical protein